MKFAFLTAMAGTFCACSTVPDKQFQDPYEQVNRQVHGFNQGLDAVIIKPVSQGYVAITPDPVEEGVSNFFSNLAYPTVVINQVLQGDLEDALEGTGRFGVNSTLGVLGVFDVATGLGLQAKQEDFGQTFAKWGIGSGPYVVSPLIGGTTLRDGVGRMVAIATSPGTWLGNPGASAALFAGQTIDTSANLLDERELIQGDSYLFLRDSYLQRRQFVLSDGAIVEDDPFLDE